MGCSLFIYFICSNIYPAISPKWALKAAHKTINIQLKQQQQSIKTIITQIKNLITWFPSQF